MKGTNYKCKEHSRTYHFTSGNTLVITGITYVQFVPNDFARLFHRNGINVAQTTTIFYDKVDCFTSNEPRDPT